ncbi:hypothetical protein 65p204 [Aeromonas phage 65]|uniref:Uncharacterized protein n=1 Tax=Aeromonas phage 65 TaxID=2919549 RepID=E5DS38_9CAUD|nr:hypothetical protein ST65p204 [Aeromonas phage 65]ADQ53212.1 hypothetical protein 65p204 [Aeromonas phage 65]
MDILINRLSHHFVGTLINSHMVHPDSKICGEIVKEVKITIDFDDDMLYHLITESGEYSAYLTDTTLQPDYILEA